MFHLCLTLLKMAENDSSTSGDGRAFTTVVSLLRQAESLLSGQLPSPSPANQRQNGPHANTSGASSSINVNGNTSTNTSDRSLANFRTLFARYSGSRSGLPSSSLGQARALSAPPRKRRKGGNFARPFLMKETWTHDFFCLADHLEQQQPPRVQKFTLQDAGLGRKTIVFNRNDQASAFMEKIESVYPKLENAGGFELLWSGPFKDLVVITPPPSGYSVPFLRESSGLGQVLAYIRPLQRSLDLDSSQPLFKV